MVALGTVSRKGICIRARDVSRQKLVQVEDLSHDMTIGELVQGLLSNGMCLPQRDVAGRPLNYHARHEREGRHLHASERVGDALQDNDEIVLQPQITAGSC